MLIYFAILPQFINQSGNTVQQGLILSFIFIGLILLVYCALSLILGKIISNKPLDVRKQKWIDGGSGTLLTVAAVWLTVS